MIHYTFSNTHSRDFAETLRSRVNGYFRDQNISRNANQTMKVKSAIALIFYVGIYVSILFSGITSIPLLFVLWALLGLGQAFIGTNVMHDVIHGSYSKDKDINRWMHIFPLIIGVEPLTWKIQHNVLHHTYTNIEHADEDIEVRFLLRMTQNQPRKWFHRFQHIYVVILYSIPIIIWATAKDFIKMFKYRKLKLVEGGRSFWITVAGIAFRKLLFHTFFIGVPVLVLGISIGWAVLMLATMLIVTGLTLSLIFQTAHLVSDLDVIETENPEIDENWLVHQLHTTTNYATNSPFFSWFYGSLNFQVEHHLFPNICHVHYPKISSIVKSTAEEFGLPYHCQGSFGKAVYEHFKLLRLLGKYDELPDTKTEVFA
ncbi:MAG: acyl-CoA desaturase [Cytophagales bacterium]|nr:acyl-CoA desaturase [Cytophagales bacterium]